MPGTGKAGVKKKGNASKLCAVLKILGGQFRSRRLKTPRENDVTRPWTAKTRESVMNQLRGHLNDSIILDLFAGVGTMGLEAISRGANTVVMVEKDRKIFTLLQENIEILGCQNQAVPIQADALSSIPLLRVPRPIDVVFIDPPYAMMKQETLRNMVLEQIDKISPILDPEGLIVLRTPENPKYVSHAIESLTGPEIHKEGAGMWILFYATKSDE
ncbi:MAG: 16S rRNA (guanine(966)-N(2))-methyltransferase RsmD [Phycisphaerae bacterium]|jgi:16S rRNA (guanine966-N2)-methyltransferase|nr:16S rRNA (guanine(966)-N(2))-methyltransferase RsmD [Phycisphaerae bacterium]